MIEVLRLYYEALEKQATTCPVEPNFTEVYEVVEPILGSPVNTETRQRVKNQLEIIFNENPGKHCELIQISPTACDGCKNNPHGAKKRIDREKIEKYNWLLGKGLDLYNDHYLGVMDNPLTLPCFDFQILSTMCQFFEHKKTADLTRGLGQILAAMFGGGK